MLFCFCLFIKEYSLHTMRNSNYLNPKTTVNTNAPLVAKTAALIRAMDKDIMTPDEAREFLKIKRN